MTILRAQLFISLDGVVEDPEQWHFPYVDAHMMHRVEDHFSTAQSLLLGRKTFEIFARSWPGRPRDSPLSARINSMRKLVVTSRGDLPPWENSRPLTGSLADSVARAKDETDAPIAIAGSVRLVRELVRVGLLDELQLMIHPLVLGTGTRLFNRNSVPLALRVGETETLPSGVVYAQYLPHSTNDLNR